MDDAGKFLDKYGEPFWYRWTDDSYRLERVTSSPGLFDVPVREDRRLVAIKWSELPRNTIVLGEDGAGVGTFQNWLMEKRGDLKRPTWVSLSPEDATAHLSTGDESTNYVIDATTRVLDSEQRSRALAELAGIMEASTVTGKCIFITHQPEDLVSQGSVFSELSARCHTYRLPHFTADELGNWIDELLAKRDGSTLDPERRKTLGRQIKRSVGGQPTLTHLLFSRVDRNLNADRPVTAGAFETAIERETGYLIDHPPGLVQSWSHDLQQLLARPEVRRRLETYAKGTTKSTGDHYDRIDVDLYLTGWVGLDAEGLWRMRSVCHEDWIRRILRGEIR